MCACWVGVGGVSVLGGCRWYTRVSRLNSHIAVIMKDGAFFSGHCITFIIFIYFFIYLIS